MKRQLNSSSIFFFVVGLLSAFGLRLFDLREFWKTTSDLVVKCGQANYQVRILSLDPLMIHVENFISVEERQAILSYASSKLQKSSILLPNGTSIFNDYRTSSSAPLPINETAAACVSKRFLEFQGYIPSARMETIQVTHYEEGQQYKEHLDFRPNATNIDTERFRRATTGFAILDADCEHCGTRFPRIRTNWTNGSPDWCRIVECEESRLTVKALPGSLLFWQNVRSDGEVDLRMSHSGLPLAKGASKTGLNLWTNIDLWNSTIVRSTVAKSTGKI